MRCEQETEIRWISKLALTEGIFPLRVATCADRDAVVHGTSPDGTVWFCRPYHPDESHSTQEEAAAHAEFLRQSGIEDLQRRILDLASMDFRCKKVVGE